MNTSGIWSVAMLCEQLRLSNVANFLALCGGTSSGTTQVVCMLLVVTVFLLQLCIQAVMICVRKWTGQTQNWMLRVCNDLVGGKDYGEFTHHSTPHTNATRATRHAPHATSHTPHPHAIPTRHTHTPYQTTYRTTHHASHAPHSYVFTHPLMNLTFRR